jgi:alanine dehydrogenase
MRIGIPRERKDGERRVGATPDGVRMLVADGHAVLVETDAGAGVGFTDADFRAAGATIVHDVSDVWSCELVAKVKELQPDEYPRLKRGTAILGYAQLNRDPRLLAAVLVAGVDVIGCETVRDAAGGLPLLASGCWRPADRRRSRPRCPGGGGRRRQRRR